MDFSNQRLSYDKATLEQLSLPDSPFVLIEQWIDDALSNDVPEPYAMSLATCGTDKKPSVRVVLMRELTETGVVFYTNYLSAKGEDIAQNPQAEVLFFWHEMQRQIRLSGPINKISRNKTDTYFQKRPYESQIGAWVSNPQSGVINDRAQMDTRFAELKQQYPEGSHVPTPEFWGGYEITAHEIEFWQGRPNRLHDRILYQKNTEAAADKTWMTQRLLP